MPIGAERSVRRVKKTEPKTTTRMIGVRSIILTSGARVSERKPAREMAEACSGTQGNAFSSRWPGGCAVFVGGAAAAARLFPALNCPVYKRTVVR